MLHINKISIILKLYGYPWRCLAYLNHVVFLFKERLATTMIQMKNRIRDDITCARASSDCRERNPNLMGQMKEVGE